MQPSGNAFVRQPNPVQDHILGQRDHVFRHDIVAAVNQGARPGSLGERDPGPGTAAQFNPRMVAGAFHHFHDVFDESVRHMHPVDRPRAMGFGPVALVVVAYAVAMACLEAAVVVDLAGALGARVGDIFPLRPALSAGDLVRIEAGREVAASWDLPVDIADAIADHHEGSNGAMAWVTWNARRVAWSLGIGDGVARPDGITLDPKSEDAEIVDALGGPDHFLQQVEWYCGAMTGAAAAAA